MGSLSEVESQSTMMKRKKKKKEMERYIVCLEEEMRKIEVFKRELPLSMQLIFSAIQTSKKELRECNENEQLIRVKGRIPLDSTSHHQAKAPELGPRKTFEFWTPDQAYDHAEKILHSMTNPHKKHTLEVVCSPGERACGIDCPTNDPCDLTPPYLRDVLPFSRDKHRTKFSLVFPKDRRQGAFSPFLPKDGMRISSNVESGENPSSLTLNEDYISHQESLSHSVDDRLDHSMSSRDDEEPNMKLDEGNVQNASIVLSLNSGRNRRHSSKRKQRRCWSPELHRKFIKALQLLGGPRVATPKLIRELMNVDGLTNDEVKSHLQKHRLNARRPNRSSKLNETSPSLVLLGGVWVPHDRNGIQHDEREHIYNNVLNPPLSEGSSEEISCAPMHTFIR